MSARGTANKTPTKKTQVSQERTIKKGEIKTDVFKHADKDHAGALSKDLAKDLGRDLGKQKVEKTEV